MVRCQLSARQRALYRAIRERIPIQDLLQARELALHVLLRWTGRETGNETREEMTLWLRRLRDASLFFVRRAPQGGGLTEKKALNLMNIVIQLRKVRRDDGSMEPPLWIVGPARRGVFERVTLLFGIEQRTREPTQVCNHPELFERRQARAPFHCGSGGAGSVLAEASAAVHGRAKARG